MANFRTRITVKGLGEAVVRTRDAKGRFTRNTGIIIDTLAAAAAEILQYNTPIASGRLAGSTTYEVSRTHESWRIKIEQTALSRTGIRVSLLRGYGRGPGGRPPAQAILQWIIDTGITPNPAVLTKSRKNLTEKQLAYAIAKQIGQFGTHQFYSGDAPYWEDALVEIDAITTEALSNIRTNLVTIFDPGSPTI